MLWDAVSGKEIETRGWSVYSQCAVLSRDLRRAAVANHQDVDLWELETGPPLVRAFLDHPGTVQAVAFSRDGKRLAAGCGQLAEDDRSQRSEVWVWDVEGGKRVRAIPVGPLSCRGVALSPDGERVAVLGTLGTFTGPPLCLFDVGTGAERARLAVRQVLRQPGLEFSPDGRLLAATCEGGVRVWEVVAGRR